MKVLDDSGEVKVLAVIETGGYFGEMALFSSDGGRRTASVRAVTYCDLFVLSKTDFEELLAKSNNRPLELKIRSMAERRQRQTRKVMTASSNPSPALTPLASQSQPAHK
jgi:CRP-like cAMP-binding protein